MRAGRFGSKAGRVAVVAALVLGTLVAGAAAANADEFTSANDTAAATIGQSASEMVTTLANGWE
jgi:hypothetical protein